MTTYTIVLPDGKQVTKNSKRDNYKFACVWNFNGKGWEVKGLSSEKKGSETIANHWISWGKGAVDAKVIEVTK